MNKKKEKKVVRTQKWIVETFHYEDGTSMMQRTNDGYSPLELIGLSELISSDVKDQIRGKVLPTEMKRIVLVD